jgi:hypothetical protein
MNDARDYRVNAAECPLAGKSCQPCYRTLLLFPLRMACARPTDEAMVAPLVVR